MNAISASQLKTRGVSVLAEELQSEPEAIITVRGKDQYVVMRIEQYLKTLQLLELFKQAVAKQKHSVIIPNTVLIRS